MKAERIGYVYSTARGQWWKMELRPRPDGDGWVWHNVDLRVDTLVDGEDPDDAQARAKIMWREIVFASTGKEL